ncbi:hypothetical protein GQ457_12G002470 [Hibiscus cannabinus]
MEEFECRIMEEFECRTPTEAFAASYSRIEHSMINLWLWHRRWRWRWPDIEQGSAISEPTSELLTAPAPPKPATDRPSIQAGCAIYEVPHRLRKVNEIAYEPNVISIGPYHHGKPHLKAMELIKRRCFDQILEVTNLEFSDFIKAMEAFEERVRKCYGGPVVHCGNFLEMMVYDGCFIVQLIRGIFPIIFANWNDIFKLTCVMICYC